jgi:hypothetical protein
MHLTGILLIFLDNLIELRNSDICFGDEKKVGGSYGLPVPVNYV